jgi:hypothetical protein
MDALTPSTLCPVCGYTLGFLAWNDRSPSDEICPSCGIQFGYDDAAGSDEVARQQIYHRWRQKWIMEGMPWNSHGRSRPAHWDPHAQLHRIGIDVDASQ